MDNRAVEILGLAQDLGFGDVIVDTYTVNDLQVRFSNNEVDIVNQWRDQGNRLFLAKGQRIITTEVKEAATAKETLRGILKILGSTKENPDYGGIYGGPFTYAPTPVDRKLVSLDNPAEAVEAAVEAAGQEGAGSCAGSLLRRWEVHDLATSAGARGRDERASIELSIRAFADREASGHGIAAASRLEDFHPEVAGREAGEVAHQARKPVLGKEGNYDVVLAPMVFGALVDAFAYMASAPTVMAGMSMFQDRLGKKVASPQITVTDDPTDEAAMGHRAFDDEGMPARPVPLVEEGILRTYLHNTSTAKKFGAEPTGSAHLGDALFANSFLQPAPCNLGVSPGELGREEILGEVKDGLYLTNTWYTRYQNRITGDFSTIPRDGIFRIKDGELVESWKDIRVTENLLDLFQRIDAVTREAPQVRWWGEVPVPTKAPWVVVRKVNITTSKD